MSYPARAEGFINIGKYGYIEYFYFIISLMAGAVEYTDCISVYLLNTFNMYILFIIEGFFFVN